MNSTLPVESTGGRTAWETAARSFFFHFTDTVIFLALEVRQLHGLAVVVAPHEVGRLVSGIEHELSFRQRARTISAAKASSASQSYGPSRNAMQSRVQPSARNRSTIARASLTVPRR